MEPVRDWLKSLNKEDREIIGEDIKVVQFRWPLGMPLVRKIEVDLWEVRSKIGNGDISRRLSENKEPTAEKPILAKFSDHFR